MSNPVSKYYNILETTCSNNLEICKDENIFNYANAFNDELFGISHILCGC